MDKAPRIVVGGDIGGGKSVAQMQMLIKEIKKLDGTPVANKIIAEEYNEKLQRISGGDVGARIWVMGDLIHCTVVYPNSAVKELLEWR